MRLVEIPNCSVIRMPQPTAPNYVRIKPKRAQQAAGWLGALPAIKYLPSERTAMRLLVMAEAIESIGLLSPVPLGDILAYIKGGSEPS